MDVVFIIFVCWGSCKSFLNELPYCVSLSKTGTKVSRPPLQGAVPALLPSGKRCLNCAVIAYLPAEERRSVKRRSTGMLQIFMFQGLGISSGKRRQNKCQHSLFQVFF